MHEIKGEQSRAAQGHHRFAEQILQEHIQQGHHQHAHQSTHKPPAKGSHAKQLDTQGDDQLAQRRVGDLIGSDAPEVFQSGAGVVNFIEIGAVGPAGGIGRQLLLVEQSRRVLPIGDRDQCPCLIKQGQLSQLQLLLGGGGAQAKIPAGQCRVLRQLGLPPVEQVGVVLLQLQTGPVLPVLRDFQGVCTRPKAGVKLHPAHGHGVLRGEDDALSVLELQPALRGRQVAQAPKSADCVDGGQQQQGQRIFLFHWVELGGEGKPFFPLQSLPTGDPLQRSLAGPHSTDVINIKDGQPRCQQHRPYIGHIELHAVSPSRKIQARLRRADIVYRIFIRLSKRSLSGRVDCPCSPLSVPFL